MPNEFVKDAAKRGLGLDLDGLQALHRLRLLVPMFRVRRDGRAVAALARSNRWDRRGAGQDRPTGREELIEARARNALFDPTTEGFVGRSRLTRDVSSVTYQASEFLYSPYQLLAIPWLRKVAPFIRYDVPDARAAKVDPRAWRDLFLRPQLQSLPGLIVPLTAIEPMHYPAIVGRFLGHEQEWQNYRQWKARLSSTALIRWLAIDADWLRQTAARLLRTADSIDPLGGWSKLVREASLTAWEELKGDALNALELRMSAETFLREYERLVSARRAQALPARQGMARGEFDTRLQPTGRRDPVLTELGLSPHPRVLLLVEGDTEELLFPRVMAELGISTDREFIAIENRKGVTQPIASLIAFAIAPRTEPEPSGRFLRTLRPITHLLVASDAEGRLATPAQRKRSREIWIDRIMQTLPNDQRTETVRQTLGTLVHVETWKGGQSFEFAHFTDLQIATAMQSIDTRQRQPKFEDRRARISQLRREKGNLDQELGSWGSKVDLADALWPVLLMKIAAADRRGTARKIPIVEVAARAAELALSIHPGGVMISLGAARSPAS